MINLTTLPTQIIGKQFLGHEILHAEHMENAAGMVAKLEGFPRPVYISYEKAEEVLKWQKH